MGDDRRMTALTRPRALVVVGVLYVLLGVGWLVIGERPELLPWLAAVRPWAWVLSGLVVIATRGRAPHPIAGLGALAAERVVVLLALTPTTQPLGWYSALWYVALWWAVLTSASLPDPTRRRPE